MTRKMRRVTARSARQRLRRRSSSCARVRSAAKPLFCTPYPAISSLPRYFTLLCLLLYSSSLVLALLISLVFFSSATRSHPPATRIRWRKQEGREEWKGLGREEHGQEGNGGGTSRQVSTDLLAPIPRAQEGSESTLAPRSLHAPIRLPLSPPRARRQS